MPSSAIRGWFAPSMSMEIREFAERILFAKTVEEKLLPPSGDLVDECPGPAIVAPSAPGRPAELRFKQQGVARDNFPGLAQLEDERERGRLLHFFANHELLATELMALVLLRFPDAPAAFRRGVVATLKDEQEHTRLYLERMRACGIAFGEIPVSGYFWRCVSGMENPMDYVAGLSLTFEQANLDFARHFAQGFSTVGDSATAELLERIYRDEIGHVAYGLKWFRRWKNPGQSDWEAFCRTLKFPLSPQRAKGFSVNFAGRSAAGLDPQFIAELDVFSLSKGRTPTVFVFNPFAEGYLAHGRGFTPVKAQQQMAADLASLPQFLCRQDDIVLVPSRPRVKFLSDLKHAGFTLPEFVTITPGRAVCIEEPGTGRPRKLGGLRPWAWSPDSLALLDSLMGQVAGGPGTTGQPFHDGIARLFSKSWSVQQLRELLRERESTAWLCTREEVGLVVRSVAEALEAVAAIRARGHHRIVIKEAFGMAGHNAIRLLEPEITPAQRRWLATALEEGREAVVEPWLDRVIDFSLQCEMTDRGLELRGFTGLINDAKGQFRANWAGPDFARHVPGQVVMALADTSTPASRADTASPRATRGTIDRQSVSELFADVRSRLTPAFREGGYRGPVGIDAFVYRDAAGRVRLKPIVEVNPRYTMGRVTVELMKRVVPGSWGVFRLLSRKLVQVEGFGDFERYAEAVSRTSPVILRGEPEPRIREGVVFLNDPTAAQASLAEFRVTRECPPEAMIPC